MKAGVESGMQNQPPALITYWIRAVIGVALILLIAVTAVVFIWASKVEAYGMRQLESCGGMLVRELGSRAAVLQGRLEEWGTDPQLQAILRSGDPADLRSREEDLAQLIPGVSGVRLFKQDVIAFGRGDASLLSYAGLDLLHQAEREREITPLEVHRLGQPDVHLAVAGPVFDEQGANVLGVVHVALPLSLLPSTSEAGGEWGQILFQQQVGDQVVTLDPGRGGVIEMGMPDYQVDVPGTRLRVVAWLTRGGVFDSDLPLYMCGAYLCLLLLMIAVMWLPLRAAKRALAVEYPSVFSLIEDAVNRPPLKGVQHRLSEAQFSEGVLGRLRRTMQPARGRVTRVSQRPVAAEPSGDAISSGGAPLAASSLANGPSGIEVEELSEQPKFLGGAGRHSDQVPAEIFRAYDIRGIVGRNLSSEVVADVGRAVATEAADAGDRSVIIARDTRPSGVELSKALAAGLRASGCDVLDLGVVPTPVLYFSTCYQGATSGVMVTGSHNPSEYNGMKVVIGGRSLNGAQVAALRERILTGAFTTGSGGYRERDLTSDYIDRVEKDVAIARTLKLVIDCGNAAAAVVAPELYRALGCDVVELNCDPKMGFPDGRVPDPARPECLELLQQRVVAEAADLGLAFDGDGDRLGVVDSAGKVISADRLLMLLAADVLSRHPGTDVIFDVKCSHHLASEILRYGGRPVMWKSGHSLLKAKLRETGALLAGEWSGHIIYQDRWFGFDDALYAGARLLEVLALDPRSSAEVFAELPESPLSSPELFLPMLEGESGRIMEKIMALTSRLDGVEVQTVDGLRLAFDRGWGLVRASNTQPVLVFRFEADDQEAMDKIQGLMRRLMAQVAPDLTLPF